ncbi:PQQ-dependent sugar dehydrogenase [Streptomyces sp. NPDC059740]|uniref:PQQ-dependent sugar dehydrogenase n=1 Tax=Streptomyces sp. NPDC059740 TaxID=3346926 RepID=UPI003652204A
MSRRRVSAVCALALALLVGGCSQGGSRDPAARPPAGTGAPSASRSSSAAPATPPARGSVKVLGTLTSGLDSPWGLAALPGGDLLVSSRDTGVVERVSVRDGRRTRLGRVPGVDPGGEGGLLGLAVPPTYGSDHQVYAYFTTASDNRIARMGYDPGKPAGHQLGAVHVVLRGIPKGQIHNGGRIAFGPDRMLYAGTGESGQGGRAQDEKSPAGKILRMTPDGRPAPGNPDPSSVVYSSGHRNVQGLAWDRDGRLWASEFGQDTWDELNLIRRGGNYGWPEVEGRRKDAGKFVNPVAQWHTDQASPSGVAYVAGSVWLAGLRGERLWRVPLTGPRAAARPQAFLTGRYGRLRTVLPAGDSQLWLVTSNTDGRGKPRRGDDRILRLRVS